MAILTIDSKTLELTLKVGVLEEYKPTDKIVELCDRVRDLKKKTSDKIGELVGTITDQKIAAKILKDNKDKRQEWKKFLDSEYNADLTDIIEMIREVNKKICPDYMDFIKKT